MMGSMARADRIGGQFPWPLGAMIRKTLSKCGDCPERLPCLEKHIIKVPLIEIMDMIGDCPARPVRSSWISRTAASFVRNNCNGCKALGPCCASVEWYATKQQVTLEDLTSDLSLMPLAIRVRKCGECEQLPSCIKRWMNALHIRPLKVLLGYWRMRRACPK